MKYALFCLLVLAGCAGPSLPVDFAAMSAEQLKAVVSDKNATVGCSVVNGPWGKGVVMYVVLDKATIVSGTVAVNGNDCGTTITAAPKASP